MGVWDGLDECEISRPEILFQSAPGHNLTRGGTVRVKKKTNRTVLHTQLAHARTAVQLKFDNACVIWFVINNT